MPDTDMKSTVEEVTWYCKICRRPVNGLYRRAVDHGWMCPHCNRVRK